MTSAPEQIAAYRAASIHAGSGKVGDRSAAPRGSTHIFRMVRIADSLASMQTPEECTTVANHLTHLSAALNLTRPQAFTYHRVDECRGVLTQLIHRATAELLEHEHGYFPLLFFPNAVLYIRDRAVAAPDASAIAPLVATRVFNDVRKIFATTARDVAAEAYNRPYEAFETYALVFCSLNDLLVSRQEVVMRPRGKAAGLLRRDIDKRMTKDLPSSGRPPRYRSASDFYTRYCVDARAEDDEDFAGKWRACSDLLRAVENLVETITPWRGKERLTPLAKMLDIPSDIVETVRLHLPDLTRGGRNYDHLTIFAYHYLVRARFATKKISAGGAELSEIADDLVRRATEMLRPYASSVQLLARAESYLALSADLCAYLQECLTFSFAAALLTSDLDRVVHQPRKREYPWLCTFCNRTIPASMRACEVKVQIAEVSPNSFSNRLLPKVEGPATRRWCPMCYFEFTLRSLLGCNYANGADSPLSRRLYLFLLPDYSFTPELFEFVTESLLRPFQEITSLPLRTFGSQTDEAAAPARWLNRDAIPSEVLDDLLRMFCCEADRMAETPGKATRRRRDLPGERLLAVRESTPSFQLMVCEKSVPRDGKDLTPSSTEMWVRGVYAAVLVHLLLGMRVYVTDRPYLPLSRADELKTVIGFDGAAPALRGVIPSMDGISLVDLDAAVTALSALWVVNEGLTRGMSTRANRDKQVAARLDRLMLEPLAGAEFFKEFERSGHVDGTFTRACEVLLMQRGGQKMDLSIRW